MQENMHKLYKPMITKLLLNFSGFHHFDWICPFRLQQ